VGDSERQPESQLTVVLPLGISHSLGLVAEVVVMVVVNMIEDRKECQSLCKEENLLQVESKFQDFQWLLTLGVGSFARVELVRNNQNKKVALKMIKKDLMADSDIVKQQVTERLLMEISGEGSLFVVQYFGSLSSPTCLVLMMEACLGGDVWEVMQDRGGRLEDHCALFYIACVIEGLKYLISKSILYRDLKPENLLVDSETGYVKIADFGFSRMLGSERAHTIVGTAEYIAPEMLNGEGYDWKATLWSLGILTYELLAGHPPFMDQERKTLFSLIGKGFRGHVFPENVGVAAGEVIRMLCRLNPAQRPDLEIITRFSWFTGFEWDKLRSGLLEAPILPSGKKCTSCPSDLQSVEETLYFDF